MEFDDTPWTPWTKKLSESKVAMVSTAGLHLRGDQPFVGGDQTYRVIPSSAKANDIIMSHTSIGWDHTGFYRDLNLAFPMDRLKELDQQSVIGSLAKDYYSFMGAQQEPVKILEETGPDVARRMKAEGVDAVFMVPV
jgi:D-proline reductase (dithiol) PrdB